MLKTIHQLRILGFIGIFAFGCVAIAGADIIDFEDAASYGGDNADIPTRYFQEHGVTFSMFVDKHSSQGGKGGATAWSPRFEQTGYDDKGDSFNYTDPSTGRVVFGPGLEEGLDNYYMAVTDNMNDLKKIGYVRLEIDYDTAVNGASGELWDLDENVYGTEQFKITAFNSKGEEVATLTSPDVSFEENLDGLPWSWSVAGSDITKITMETVGTRTNYLGLAFDNFNATEANADADGTAHAAPIPMAAPIAAVGMAFLAARRFRRRRCEEDMDEDDSDDDE